MSVYGARVRMGRDLAEKALCASGRQSLFIRPIDVGGFPEAGSFSLVWATMPETPVEQLLATVLAHTAQLAGHRGQCRSASGLGVRTPWTLVSEARQLLRGGDTSLTDANRSLKDVLAYTVHGVPVGVQRDELTQALAELPWAVIVQSRVGRQDAVCLARPLGDYLLHHGGRASRKEEGQAQADQAGHYASKHASAFYSESTAPTQMDDPLASQDAWATYLGKQGRGAELAKGHKSAPGPATASPATSATTASSSSGVPANTSGSGSRPAAEVRVDVLAQRVSALETGQATMLQKQASTAGRIQSLGEQVSKDREQLEGKIDNMDKAMHNQFSEILAKLAELSSNKARRTGES
eukprot:3918702-Amphidinium_carterae.1